MYYAGYIFIKCTIHGQETTFMYCLYLFVTSKLCSSLTQFVWPHCVLLYVLCWFYIHKTYNLHGQETTFMYCMYLFLSRDHFIKFHGCLGVIVFNYVYLSPDSKVPVEQTFIHMNVSTRIYLILHNVHVTVMS